MMNSKYFLVIILASTFTSIANNNIFSQLVEAQTVNKNYIDRTLEIKKIAQIDVPSSWDDLSIGGEEALERARQYRETPEHHLGVARVFYQNGEYRLALKSVNTAIEKKPQYLKALSLRGLIHYKLEQYEQALIDYDRVVDMDRNDAGNYNLRGSIHERLKKYELALSDYNKAIELDPNQKSIYLNRGIAHHRLKQYDLAEADYKKALEIDPQPIIYNNLGIIYQDRGNKEVAAINFQKAYDLATSQGDSKYAEYVAKVLDTFPKYGAIAISNSTGEYGYSWGFNSREEAANTAIDYCGIADCKYMTLDEENNYGALAIAGDGKWRSSAKTQEEAINNSLNQCKQSSTVPNTCQVNLILNTREVIHHATTSTPTYSNNDEAIIYFEEQQKQQQQQLLQQQQQQNNDYHYQQEQQQYQQRQQQWRQDNL